MVESIEHANGHRVISDLSEARDKIANLERALVSSRRIGAAIGVIMASRKVTYEQALALLRGASQATHRKLREIAEDVLLTGLVPPHPVGTADGNAHTASPGAHAGDTGDRPAVRLTSIQPGRIDFP